MWITCLSKTGDKLAARKEFDKVLLLRPPKPDELKRWFRDLTR
jgi:hypothetical protein